MVIEADDAELFRVLSDVSKPVAIIVRRGSRITIENIANAGWPRSYEGLPIITVDELDDIRILGEDEMRDAGWVRGSYW